MIGESMFISGIMSDMKITLFIVPAILLIVGLVSKFHPAKNINAVFGYRSGKSRSSQENWDKAQALMAKYMLMIGLAELVITLIAVLVAGNLTEQQYPVFLLVMVAIQTLGLVLVIPLVESKL